MIELVTVDTLWLGYDGLTVSYAEMVAVLFYQPTFDGHIVAAWGSVPTGVRAVVVTTDGRYFPARWRVDQVRHAWARWRNQNEHQ